MENRDWKNLGFGYSETDYNVRCTYKDGKWGDIFVTKDTSINLHIGATCLHYGQEIFEGMKAYRGKDGKVRIFRMDENAKRLQFSAEGVMMEPFPLDKFEEAIIKVVQKNEKFIPPYESGASLYIRPLLIGSGVQVGVKPSDEYTFIVFAMPVGPYFKEGFKATDLVIYREFDRAAPLGTGRYKVGGNYAAGLVAGEKAHSEGFSAVLYLDAKEKKYIDECGPANFFAIQENKYITPKSSSILHSITNMSLRQLASDLGMTVEERPIDVEELATFDEVGACGTAAVISPVKRIVDKDANKEYLFGTEKPGPKTTLLYEKLRGIQYGTEADIHNWNTIVEITENAIAE